MYVLSNSAPHATLIWGELLSIIWEQLLTMLKGFGSRLFNFVVPYLFNVDEANLGGKTGFFFTGLCLVGLAVIYFEIPEMKGRTYEELDEMFELRLHLPISLAVFPQTLDVSLFQMSVCLCQAYCALSFKREKKTCLYLFL